MAVTPVRVALLQQSIPIVDSEGRPTPAFVRLINDNNGNVVASLNAIRAIPEIQQALGNLDAATQAAQNAATAAQQAAAGSAREQALVNSYIDPASVVTADPTTITIAAHTRRYADGSSVPVNGGTVAATAPSDVDYVFYDDSERDGGTVVYQVGTTPPAQTGDRHVVGAVTIPATGTAPGGEGPQRPGYVKPYDIADQ